jgi:hypothetical protein
MAGVCVAGAGDSSAPIPRITRKWRGDSGKRQTANHIASEELARSHAILPPATAAERWLGSRRRAGRPSQWRERRGYDFWIDSPFAEHGLDIGVLRPLLGELRANCAHGLRCVRIGVVPDQAGRLFRKIIGLDATSSSAARSFGLLGSSPPGLPRAPRDRKRPVLEAMRTETCDGSRRANWWRKTFKSMSGAASAKLAVEVGAACNRIFPQSFHREPSAHRMRQNMHGRRPARLQAVERVWSRQQDRQEMRAVRKLRSHSSLRRVLRMSPLPEVQSFQGG